MISIQEEDFEHGHEYQKLRQNNGDGAIVTFTGLVRDLSESSEITAIRLEHYPGMTEQAISNICSEARTRWALGQIRVIHRIGLIAANEQIVFVGVTAKHRTGAFSAAEFIMDFLKMQVPLWKQEQTQDGFKWVDMKTSDQEALARWEQTKETKKTLT